jgi:hypothetical protein
MANKCKFHLVDAIIFTCFLVLLGYNEQLSAVSIQIGSVTSKANAGPNSQDGGFEVCPEGSEKPSLQCIPRKSEGNNGEQDGVGNKEKRKCPDDTELPFPACLFEEGAPTAHW